VRCLLGGRHCPLTAIEQITYLVFLKRLEDLDLERARAAQEAGREYHSIYALTRPTAMAAGESAEGAENNAEKRAGEQRAARAVDNTETTKRDQPVDKATFRWSYLKQLPPQERWTHVRGPVFAWLQEIEEGEEKERMRDAVFLIPNPNLLTKAVEIIDKLFVPERNQDTLGDIYEHLLKEIAVAGKNGQFRTPRHIIRAMCDLIDPRYGERICDPACGTGGFLVNAYQHILKSHTSADILRSAADGTPIDALGDKLSSDQHLALRRNHLHGFDFDRTMVRLGWMNLIQHGLESPDVRYGDTLGSTFNRQVDPNQGDLAEALTWCWPPPPLPATSTKVTLAPPSNGSTPLRLNCSLSN
jgi:type I restriction enzyme M protein